MSKKTQGEKLNQLAEVVAQIAQHVGAMAALLVEGSEPIQHHLQQLAELADNAADSRAPKFDFALQPEEVEGK